MRAHHIISFGPSRDEQNCLPKITVPDLNEKLLIAVVLTFFGLLLLGLSTEASTVSLCIERLDVSHSTKNPFVFITKYVLCLLFESTVSHLFVWRQAATFSARHIACKALSQQTILTETWCSVSSKKMSLETTAARQQQQQQHEVGHSSLTGCGRVMR